MDAALNYLAILLFTISLLFFLTRNFSNRRLPPGSLGLPVIGQTLQLLKAMRDNTGEEWLQERVRKYGPISKLHLFGRPTVFLQGQAAHKFIFTADANTLSNRPFKSIRRLVGEMNPYEITGETHKRLRGVVVSFLKPEALKEYIGKMEEVIKLHLNQHWHHNHQIKLVPLTKSLAFDMISTLLFGIERGSRRQNLQLLFHQFIQGLMGLPINLPYTRFNRSLRARSKIGEIIRELIHEKRGKMQQHGPPDCPDLITTFLSMRDLNNPLLSSDEEIVTICVMLMFAGHDSTSYLLALMIKILCENPNVHQTVLKEQEEVARGKVSGEHLTWDDLAKMKYTWRVATEILRMYPSLLFHFRQVLRDIEMGGYIIPKGWQVISATHTTHLNESIFPDPYKFDPSRYEEQGAVPAFSFVAFGGGPRMCPGNEFTRVAILTTIHYLVINFRWKLCLEENVMSRDPLPTFKEGLPILIERATTFNIN